MLLSKSSEILTAAGIQQRESSLITGNNSAIQLAQKRAETRGKRWPVRLSLRACNFILGRITVCVHKLMSLTYIRALVLTPLNVFNGKLTTSSRLISSSVTRISNFAPLKIHAARRREPSNTSIQPSITRPIAGKNCCRLIVQSD